MNATTDDDLSNDSDLVVDSLRLWGGIYFASVFVFCILRLENNKLYNVRSWVPHMECSLAKREYDFFSWMWKVFQVTDQELFRERGLDILCFIRALRFGIKLGVVGTVNALWLIPTYLTARESEETEFISDPFVRASISNLPASSPRYAAVALAAYIVCGSTAYLILLELKWYTQWRHRFLSQRIPRNYAVYISGIPKAYRTDYKLAAYFRTCISEDSILEVHVAMDTPDLEVKQTRREVLVRKMEHTMALERKTGEVQTFCRFEGELNVERVRWLDHYREELDTLNEEIPKAITDIRSTNSHRTSRSSDWNMTLEDVDEDLSGEDASDIQVILPAHMRDSLRVATLEPVSEHVESDLEDVGVEPPQCVGTRNTSTTSMETGPTSVDSAWESGSESQPVSLATMDVREVIRKQGSKVGKKIVSTGGAVVPALLIKTEGEPRDAGFVVFRTLSAAQAALQMVHHPRPYTMKAEVAPHPEFIFWRNVGMPRQSRRAGTLLSLGATVALCLFWTIPISFISSMTEVSALRKALPRFERWLEGRDWMETILEQLAPLILLGINVGLLPLILRVFSMWEGFISSAVVEASLYSKLGSFMVRQTRLQRCCLSHLNVLRPMLSLSRRSSCLPSLEVSSRSWPISLTTRERLSRFLPTLYPHSRHISFSLCS